MGKIRQAMYRIPDTAITQYMVSALHSKVLLKDALNESDIEFAESDMKIKANIVEAKRRKSPSTIRRIDKEVDEVFKRIPSYKNRDNLQSVRDDMVFCRLAYGFTPSEYFVFGLEFKDIATRRSYVSDRTRVLYRLRMNHTIRSFVFEDKEQTYKRFSKYFKRELISISDERDYDKFHDFVNRHGVFVRKIATLSQGKSVELIDSSNDALSEREIFETLILGGKNVIEERIQQSDELSSFNESSVNTVRVVTFNTRHGIEVPYCTLRTGRPGSFVDNGGSGGVQSCIDYETGLIYTDGYDELGSVYQLHPSSEKRFKGYQLPEWNELRDFVSEIVQIEPSIKFTGWDLAHTNDGWVMVEGNECCQVIAKQMIDGRGMKSQFLKLMADMDLVY